MSPQIDAFHLRSVLNDRGQGVVYEADRGTSDRFCLKLFVPWRLGAAPSSGATLVTGAYEGISSGDGTPEPLFRVPEGFQTGSLAANGVDNVAPVIASGFLDLEVGVRTRCVGLAGTTAAQPERSVDDEDKGARRIARCPWLAYPRVEGRALDTILRLRPLSLEDAVLALRSLSRALATMRYAAALFAIPRRHRDPPNLLGHGPRPALQAVAVNFPGKQPRCGTPVRCLREFST
jgi:hypothetical protein